jgi:hypothetical protein
MPTGFSRLRHFATTRQQYYRLTQDTRSLHSVKAEVTPELADTFSSNIYSFKSGSVLWEAEFLLYKGNSYD